MIYYCQWVHVDKREIIVIDVEKHNTNAVNLTDCADITISDNAAYVLITIATAAVNLKDLSANAAYGLIATAIDSGSLTDCADITISYDAADGLIATAIDAVDSTDCADNAADGDGLS